MILCCGANGYRDIFEFVRLGYIRSRVSLLASDGASARLTDVRGASRARALRRFPFPSRQLTSHRRTGRSLSNFFCLVEEQVLPSS